MDALIAQLLAQPLLFGGIGLALVAAVVLGFVLGRRRAPPALEAEPTEERPKFSEAATVELPPEEAAKPAEPAEQPAPPPSLFQRMSRGLARTREVLGSRLQGIFARSKIDDALFEALEDALIMADVGVGAAGRLVALLKEDVKRGQVTEPAGLRARLQHHVVALMGEDSPGLAEPPAEGPLVILVVGVNGGGKTTTIGKLAARYTSQGKKVLLGAGDTFRAGAIEQLQIWAERAGADIVAHAEGADPAAVLFDALKAAKARGADVVICDTAGRLQSRKPLMDQLGKVTRVLGKAVPGAPHEVLLVLDATIGQNALSQARIFGEVVGVTGIVLTKLDGTAKGGVVVAVHAETGVPVKFVGVGEQVDDLRPFAARPFAAALLDMPEEG
ncbi:MAG: signal recognition particle-docking protein FtsY [Pseudomonadota bacterium]